VAAKATMAPLKKTTPVDDVDDLAMSVSKMSVGPTFKLFTMDVSFPFMVKTFFHNGVKMCTVELFVHTQDISHFRVAVAKGRKVLKVGMCIPEWFGKEDCIRAAKKTDATINANTNEVTAHEDSVQAIRKMYQGKDEVIGKPQLIALPFQCEEEVDNKEIQIFFGDKELSEGLKAQQYASVLVVDLISTEKKVNKKKKGKIVIIGSVDPTNDTAGAVGVDDDDDMADGTL
jgi:hypothetical protein